MDIRLDQLKKVYFIGIKGSGVIALVEVLHNWGKEVVGSDVKEHFFTDAILEKYGIRYHEGFNVDNLSKETGIDLVVYSTAYKPETNEELRYAIGSGMPCLSYPEMLGLISRNKFTIAVCGTHGKTTTTAMLALAMKEAGADPTAVIGSKVSQLGSSGLVGNSPYFIIEADEYQNKFLHYQPMAIVLTHLDYDHPDFFPDYESYKQTFRDFVGKIPPHGFLVVWGGSRDTLEIAKSARCKIIIYDIFDNITEKEKIEDELANAGKNNYAIVDAPELNLTVPGRHNLLNATAVWAVCCQLKLEGETILSALSAFSGTSRRFELLGQYHGADIIDDYAHHPTEIRATLSAAKERYPDKNIICVFHPHTFTRTQALIDEFAASFHNCNEVIVLDIYGSAREKQGGVHTTDLVEKIKQFKNGVEYIPTISETYEYLKDKLSKKDVLITMGAGNVNELAQRLVLRED